MTDGHHPDRGSVTAFVTVIAVALVMVAGMAYDGGAVLTAYAEARSHATKAARAAAQEVDAQVLRSTGDVVLHPSAAIVAAQDYLSEVGATGSVVVEGDTVTVTVRELQPMHILPLPDRTVVATDSATATPSPELTDPGG